MQILCRVNLTYNQNKEKDYKQYILDIISSVLITMFFSTCRFCMGESFASTNKDMLIFKLCIA